LHKPADPSIQASRKLPDRLDQQRGLLKKGETRHGTSQASRLTRDEKQPLRDRE
jgi:hypothetical protein